MNGLSVASQGSLGVIGNDWQIAGVGDFNGDRKADILWRDTSGDGLDVADERAEHTQSRFAWRHRERLVHRVTWTECSGGYPQRLGTSI